VQVIESFEINCIRADDIFNTQAIMEDIWASIMASATLSIRALEEK
jgi:hypothetical protein